jgi:outer membrane protein assembly factor BamB
MGNRIRYSNGKLILANNMLYAYNVEDGTLAWSRDYGNSFVLSSHPIVAEGRVYANNDSGFMVCLDVETGRQIWRTDTGGSPSPIVHHDGRIYMSNVTQPGGNSLLVIDALTGEILYDVVAPYDPDVDPSPLFNDAIAVDPETGYVYTGNYRDLLVYDFP